MKRAKKKNNQTMSLDVDFFSEDLLKRNTSSTGFCIVKDIKRTTVLVELSRSVQGHVTLISYYGSKIW